MKKLVFVTLILVAGVANAGENICMGTNGLYTAPTCTGGALEVTVTGVAGVSLPEDTYITSVDHAGTGTNSLLKGGTDDDTYLNCDSGELIKFSEAGTAGVTLDPSTNGFTFASPAEMGSTTATDGVSNIFFTNGTDKWEIKAGTNQVEFMADTADAGDDQIMYLSGGGAISTDRGAYMQLNGNEVSGGGDARIYAGAAAGSDLVLGSFAADGEIHFNSGGNGGRWELEIDGDLVQTATAPPAGGGSIIMVNASSGLVTGIAAIPTDGSTAFGVPDIYSSSPSSEYNIGLVGTSNSAAGPNLAFAKTRDATNGTADVVVADGDALGTFLFYAADRTDGTNGAFDLAARLDVEVDGEPNTAADTSDTPTRFVFKVSPDGSATPAEAMRISQDKSVTVKGNLIFDQAATGLKYSSAGDDSTAALGSTQADAAELGTNRIQLVYSADGTKGVKFPAIASLTLNAIYHVFNSSASAAKLYTNAAGEEINDIAGTTAYSIAAGHKVDCYVWDADDIYCG